MLGTKRSLEKEWAREDKAENSSRCPSGRDIRGRYAVNSPPIVCRDVVIVGSVVSDGATMQKMPPGHAGRNRPNKRMKN